MNQPDSPEFTEILNRVPRWHMLTPGVDVWREYWEGKQAGYFNESKWRGFIECARFLGAIKERGKT